MATRKVKCAYRRCDASIYFDDEQRGRRPKYHSDSCRQAAYRERHRDQRLETLQWFLDLIHAEQEAAKQRGVPKGGVFETAARRAYIRVLSEATELMRRKAPRRSRIKAIRVVH